MCNIYVYVDPGMNRKLENASVSDKEDALRARLLRIMGVGLADRHGRGAMTKITLHRPGSDKPSR